MAEKDGKTSLPVEGRNPTGMKMIVGVQVVFTGIMYAVLKYVNPEQKLLAALPFTLETTMAYLVLMGGLVQGMMFSKTNWARIEYSVPWPHTFALENNPKKIMFDCVQRAHLNFVENYTQMLALIFFAAKLAPKATFIFGSFFLLGRVLFAQGYYSGVAEKKDIGVIGYLLGVFPITGLAWLYLLSQLGFVQL